MIPSRITAFFLVPLRILTAFILMSLSCTAMVAAESPRVIDTSRASSDNQRVTLRKMMGKGPEKGLDQVQAETDIDPTTWYEADKPHLRMRTRVDGVARVTGAAAIAAVEELRASPLTDIALFYKGLERPIAISDGDGDGKFSAADTVWFQGRHPFGDTTWLDRYDTTAVYFLSVRTTGVRKRFDAMPDNAGLPDGISVQHVGMNERYELDTGFYHLGNAADEVFSTYNTFWATYEGYYWSNLRGLAKTRFVQPLTLYPSPLGSVSISAHVIASTNAAQSPDNRADLTVNGAAHVFFERDGVGGEVLTSTQPGVLMPAGEAAMALYCPGIPAFEGQQGYYSDVMLDYITVRGDILPVLTDGRLRFTTPSQSQVMQIDVTGARTQRVAIIDTTNQQFAIHTSSERGTLVVASLAPVNVGNIIDPAATTAMRAFVRIDDAVFRVDSSTLYVLAYREPGGSAQIVTDMSTDIIAARINLLKTGTVIAVMGHASLRDPASSPLLDVMAGVQLPTPAGIRWVTTGIVRGQPAGSFKASDDIIALGVTSWMPTSNGSMWAPKLGLYGGAERTLFVNDFKSVEDARVERAHLTNLGADSTGVDYIYITHATHRANTDRLAAFRRQHNNVRTRIVDVDDIIDEFGAGQRSPEAIRNYLKHAWSSAPSPKPRYLLLVGNATWDPRIAVPFGNVGSTRPDQVPTFGRPSSDYWFGLLDDEYDIAVSELIVGRIPAVTADESKAQIDKIIQSDTIAFAPWMRRWQFVGGGDESEGICDTYTNMLVDVFQTGVTFLDAPFCIDTSTLCRYTAPVNAGFYLRKSIDEGVQWMNYLGHGATNTFDIGGWDATELANTGRYGVLATYACQTGSFSNPSTASENVEYVIVPNRGFMAAMGGTGWEFQERVSDIHFRIHGLMRDGARELGAIMYAAKLPYAQSGRAEQINTAMQYCLLGDPLSRVRMDTMPDPYLRQQDVVITDPAGSTQITDDGGSIILTAFVQNAGTGTNEPVTVRIRRTFNDVTDSIDVVLEDGICGSAVVRCTLDVAGRVGDHMVRIEIDPQRTLGDNLDNNTFATSVPVFARTVLPIYPHPHGVISATSPNQIRVLDPSATTPGLVTFVIAPSPDEALALRRSGPSEITRTGSVVDWNVGTLSSDIIGERWLGAWTTNASGGTSAVLWIPITVLDTVTSYGVLRQTSNRFTTNDANAVTIDSITGTVSLRADTHEVYIQSSGIQTSDLDRNPTLLFRIAQTEILRNSYRRGINIVVMSPNDTVPRVTRRYDTWIDPAPIETGHNGFAEDALKFISDSLVAGDRVLFASCDESFTQFEQRGLIDSLRVLLKGLGSGFADSLRMSSSWAMVGQRGLLPGTAPELWKGAPDSMVKLTSTLPFYASNGIAHGEWLGPARRITGITIGNGAGGDLGNGISATVITRSLTGIEDTVGTFTSSSSIDFPQPLEARYIRAALNLVHDGKSTTPSTKLIFAATYEPADEWIIEATDGLVVLADSVLRGDTVMTEVHVRNARPEQSSYAVDLLVTGTGSTLTERVFELPSTVPAIPADSTAVITIAIPSASLGSAAQIAAAVDPEQKQSESYTFNNSRTITASVREDTDTPTVEVRVDDARVRGGEYVYIHPFFDVLVHDNSQLQISDETKLTVFINGTRIRESTSTEYEFLNTASVYGRYASDDVRAATRFRFPLEIGQNNIIVKASDATGNAANYEIAVFTSTRVEVAEVVPYPNPSAGPVTFGVALADTLPTRTASLEIYDLRGIRIRSLSGVLTVGRSTFEWDGKGEEGVSVATGLYMWKLSATDAGGEPLSHRTGTLTVLR